MHALRTRLTINITTYWSSFLKVKSKTAIIYQNLFCKFMLGNLKKVEKLKGRSKIAARKGWWEEESGFLFFSSPFPTVSLQLLSVEEMVPFLIDSWEQNLINWLIDEDWLTQITNWLIGPHPPVASSWSDTQNVAAVFHWRNWYITAPDCWTGSFQSRRCQEDLKQNRAWKGIAQTARILIRVRSVLR